MLADYNMLVDKLNTDTERAEVELEWSELKASNEQTAQVRNNVDNDKYIYSHYVIYLNYEIIDVIWALVIIFLLWIYTIILIWECASEPS